MRLLGHLKNRLSDAFSQVSLGRAGPCNTLHERQRDPEKPSAYLRISQGFGQHLVKQSNVQKTLHGY